MKTYVMNEMNEIGNSKIKVGVEFWSKVEIIEGRYFTNFANLRCFA